MGDFDARGFVTEARASGIPESQIRAELARQGIPAGMTDSLMSTTSGAASGAPTTGPAPTPGPSGPNTPGFDVQGFIKEAHSSGLSEDEIIAELRHQGIDVDSPGSAGHYGALNAAVNGLTMGLAPRALAAIDAVTGRGSYEQALRSRLAAKQLYDVEHPTAALVSNVAGGALPFLAGGDLLPAARTLAGKVAAGAGTGAVVGAAQGAGDAAPGDVLPAAAKSGAVGAATGGALAPVAQGVAGLWQKLFGPLEPTATALATLQRSPEFKDEISNLESRLHQTLSNLNPDDPTTLLQATDARREMGDLLVKLAKKSEAARGVMESAATQHGATASKLYNAAYQQDVTLTPEIKQALADPRVQGAVATVTKKLGLQPITDDTPSLPTEALDLVKRELDKNVGQAVRMGDGASVERVGDLRDAIKNGIAEQNPDYAHALRWSATQQRLKDAVLAGRKSANTDLVKNGGQMIPAGLRATAEVGSPFLIFELTHSPWGALGYLAARSALAGGKALAARAADTQLGEVARVLTSPVAKYGPQLLQPVALAASQLPARVGGIGSTAATDFWQWLRSQQGGQP